MEKNKIIIISLVSIIVLVFVLVLVLRNNDNKNVTSVEPQSFSENAATFSENKRALLIGCNYAGTGSQLYGCIEDARTIKGFLISMGFLESNIILLIDDGTTQQPTKTNIKNNLTTLVQATSENDCLFVWYSGHGTQMRNYTSDGGFDECWCPPDTLQTGNYLTDNELSTILNSAAANSKIFIGSDSCHSATVLDLKYIAQQNQSTANRTLDEIRGKVPVSEHCFTPLQSNENISLRFVNPGNISRGANLVTLSDSTFQETQAFIVCISGCQDYDTSADAFLNGRAQGAMTWAFKQCFMENLTFSDLLVNMRNLLRTNGFPQIPQLTFGKSMDPNNSTLFSFIS